MTDVHEQPGVDARLQDFILITEVGEGHRLANPIFERKFAQPCPSFGHHVLALYRHDDLGWLPATYVKYWEHEDVMLSGGACTDGRVLRLMSPDQQQRVKDSGGLLVSAMRYAERTLSASLPATFGYCGDARAWEVFDQVGYERLDHPHLIVCWHQKPSDEAQIAGMVERMKTIGPF
ncbi:MAG: hypothetical protein ACXIUL_13225 [Wenzhouxiangella sp.]